MSKRNFACILFILVMLVFSTFPLKGVRAVDSNEPVGNAQNEPQVFDNREMTYMDEMEAYAKTVPKIDWTIKIYPMDGPRLDDALFNDSYLVVYVSDVDDVIKLDGGEDGEVYRGFRVYVPSDRIIKQLLEIPHTYFFVWGYDPAISMIVDKAALQEIARNPSVYCIRILPNYGCEPLGRISIDDARNFDKIEYTMDNHVGKVAAGTHIAVIDTGYDPNSSHLSINGSANDNIVYRYDFDDDDTNVTGDSDWHGSTVLDLIALAFGDTGESDEMYENPQVYYVLKATSDPAKVEAINFCLDNNTDIDIVCMSFGGPYHSGWCTMFRIGTQKGITWIAGTGNNGLNNFVFYPASSHYVVAVGGYDQMNEQDEAERASYSNYGTINYSSGISSCSICSSCCQTEFKPTAYEGLNFTDGDNYGAGLNGTSFCGPMACADIAIGFYSTGEYTAGYNVLLQTLSLCHTYPVVPSASSLQGDVIDTYLLWQYRNDLKVASYHLNENQGSTAGDSSPYGNTGTIYGATWTTGIIGSALSFSANQYMGVSSLTWTPTTFSVSWWIYPYGTFNYNNYVKASNGWGAFDIHSAAGGSMYCGTDVNTRFTPTDLPSGTITDNVWQQFTYTYDGTYGRLYKNGVLIAGPKAQNTPSAWTGFQVSQNDGNTANGVIDEVCIYDRALSPDEIEAHYEALVPHHQLTIYCWEIMSQGPIERWISIDDGEYFDPYGYLSVSVAECDHDIEVEDYSLMYIFDGTNYYDNPDTIMVTSDMTIVAYYFWQG